MKKKINKVTKVTKVSPVQGLKAAMAARRKSEAEVAELRGMLVEKSARRAELETTEDLNDSRVINEIGRVQVLVELLPRRIAFKEEEELKAEKSLVEATNGFIREHLSPRVRSLAERTRVIVEKELASHFRDASELIRAVAGSERVRSIERLGWSTTLRPERGAMAHAEGALKAWVGADEFEKSVSGNECKALGVV